MDGEPPFRCCGNCAKAMPIPGNDRQVSCRAHPPGQFVVGTDRNPISNEVFPIFQKFWVAMGKGECCFDHRTRAELDRELPGAPSTSPIIAP